MPEFNVVGLYAAINFALYIYLAARIIAARRSKKIGIGGGGDTELDLRIRVHGNAAEYMPFGLIGLILLSAIGVHSYILHGIGIFFTIGRILHAYGLSKSRGVTFGRLVGMVLTLSSLGITALILLFNFLTN